MTNLAAPTMRIVLYEGAGSAGLPDPVRAELMLTLLQRGYSVSCVRNGGTLASLERARARYGRRATSQSRRLADPLARLGDETA